MDFKGGGVRTPYTLQGDSTQKGCFFQAIGLVYSRVGISLAEVQKKAG